MNARNRGKMEMKTIGFVARLSTRRRTAESHVSEMLELAGAVIADTGQLIRAEVFHRIDVVAVC